jgi:hypothetical protein
LRDTIADSVKTAIVALLLVAILAAAGLFLFVRNGFSTRTEPTAAEAWVAGNLRGWSIPRTYRTMGNPVACTPEVLNEARAHWADHCATCHANNGSGDSMLGKTMYPRPPDMRKPPTQTQSDGEIYYTIKSGVRLSGMPAFGEPGDNDSDSWKLICFVRHLPQVTSEEVDAMKKLNPQTPEDLEEERREEEFLRGGTAPPVEEHHHH